MASIVLTGGGSAGHCTPHLSLIPYLKNDFDKIYYIGSENGIEKEIIEKAKIPYFSVPCAKLKREFSLDNFAIPFKVIKGIKEAGNILDEIKPSVVFSKGGYVSVPTVVAAHKRKIPVITHESDYTVGLANKIISRYSLKVLTSFPQTAGELKNGEFIGSPIRNVKAKTTKEEAVKKFGFSANKPVLLITGGSLGAKKINDTVFEGIYDLTKKFDVIHICGKGNLNSQISLKGYFQTEFLHDMEKAFAAADVCVSRAGANALFELLSIKMPTVLIPLPKGASRGDQILNAEYFQKLGLVFVLPQSALTKESLLFSVNSVYQNRNNLYKNFENNPVKDKSREISRLLADAAKR